MALPKVPSPSLLIENDEKIQSRKLINTPYIETAEGRETLKYLIDCALPNGIKISAEHNSENFVFHGGAGLAPAWLDRPLNTSEQRWVSACMLARVNYYGETVKISMRGKDINNDKLPDILLTTEDEVETFPLFEGGFYGNLFLDAPAAYACTGNHSFESLAKTTAVKRVCTHPSKHTLPSGESISKCGFILTGKCQSLPKDEIYPEIIYVYLQ